MLMMYVHGIGYFPPEAAFLSHLRTVSFHNRDFKQPLEEILQNLILNKLEVFNIPGGNLKGTLPTTLALMTNLTHLDLSKNQLTSTIPSELGLLSNLTTLKLSSNQLSGTVPTEVQALPRLEWLEVDDDLLLLQP